MNQEFFYRMDCVEHGLRKLVLMVNNKELYKNTCQILNSVIEVLFCYMHIKRENANDFIIQRHLQQASHPLKKAVK